MLRLRIHPPWLPRLINRILMHHLIWGCYFFFDVLAFLLFKPLHLSGWIALALPLMILHFHTAGRIYKQGRNKQLFPFARYKFTGILSALALIVLFFVWKFYTPYPLIGWIHLFSAIIAMANGWLEWKALHQDELIFTDEIIQIPDQWRWLRIPWEKIASVVVKDDVLTLQLTDDRWWQWEIGHGQDAAIAELMQVLRAHFPKTPDNLASFSKS